MKVINIVVNKFNVPQSVYSFPIDNESNESEIVQKCETQFIEICKEHGLTEDKKGQCLEDGYFEPIEDGDTYIGIVWGVIF